VLFKEKLELFDQIRREEPVTWSGTTRAALENYSIFPTTDHEHGLPTWVAVGGSPQSVVRAAKYGMGLELAIIGGAPQRFAPLVQLSHRHIEHNHFAPRRAAAHPHALMPETDELAMTPRYP